MPTQYFSLLCRLAKHFYPQGVPLSGTGDNFWTYNYTLCNIDLSISLIVNNKANILKRHTHFLTLPKTVDISFQCKQAQHHTVEENRGLYQEVRLVCLPDLGFPVSINRFQESNLIHAVLLTCSGADQKLPTARLISSDSHHS